MYTICMSTHLGVTVTDSATHIQYVCDGEVVLTHTHPFGLKHAEGYGLNKIAASSIRDGVIYALEHISLYDRIPTEIRLLAPLHMTWLKGVLEGYDYAQFYTDGVPVRVTLLDKKELQQLHGDSSLSSPSSSPSYARHSKTIFTFKI